jgi:outer membrane biogenesis lipoprotein LolB
MQKLIIFNRDNPMKTHTTLLLAVTLVSLLTACSGTKQLEEKKKATDAQTSPQKTTVEKNTHSVSSN